MSTEDRPRKLVLRLTDQEWAAIERAAGREGFDEVEMPMFVRKAILELIRSRGEMAPQKETQEPPPTAEATRAGKSRKPPKCACGLSRNADGSCDLSCIMRI